MVEEHHAHDATWRSPAPQLEGYSPKCLQLDFSHWAARRSPSIRFSRLPVGLFAGRCRCPTRKKSPRPSRAEITSAGALEEEETGQCATRTAIGPTGAGPGVTD